VGSCQCRRKNKNKSDKNLDKRLTRWPPSNKYDTAKIYRKLMVEQAARKAADIIIFERNYRINPKTTADDCVNNNDDYYN